LLLSVLLFGLLRLSLAEYGKYKSLSTKNCVRLLSQAGARGNILDRKGLIIAGNRLSYDVLIVPQEAAGELERVLAKVAEILGVTEKSLRDAYRKGYLSSSLPVTVAGNIKIKQAIALEQEKFDTPSIIIQPRPVRDYPHKDLAAHLLGYVGEIDRWRLTKLEDYGYKTRDIVGFGGVEEKYDYYLRQEEGGLLVEVDHRGKSTRVLGFREPRNGRDISLTLDLKVQKIAEEELAGRKGCVVMMNPFSGEIIVMASSPGFNPASFAENDNAATSAFLNDADSPLLNRSISGLYPAGSVFKVIVAAAGLETGKIKPSTSFICQGFVTIGKQRFKCWETHGEQDLTGALAVSCNTFFYHSGLLISAQVLCDYAQKFGLSKSTGFELPYEAAGFIPSPLWRKVNKFKNWYDGDTANLSIGQGDVLVTPLQMVRVMAVFANGGYLVTPYIVRAVADKDLSLAQRRNVNLHFKHDTINVIRKGMRSVVSSPSGTANVLSGLPVAVAGKTGTAQAPKGQPHAWFAGFFPFDKPRFALCVFLERGGPGYMSCLVAKRIIERMYEEGLI
jgi:penicillin-binding protein 2